MRPVADHHFPRLFAAADEPARPAPPRAVLKGIGRALGMIYGPVEQGVPRDMAELIQRLPGADRLPDTARRG